MSESIRRGVPDDAEAIARVHVATWKTAYRGLLPDELLDGMDPAERVPRWQRTLNDSGSAVYVVELQDRIVGFLAVCPSYDDATARTGELDAIYILESEAGKGIGGRLMSLSDQWMREQGFDRAVLWVLPSNEGARRFYERHGWQEDSAEKELSVPGGTVPAQRYVKSLAVEE